MIFLLDNNSETNSQTLPVFAMSGDEKDDVAIPMVFLFGTEGATLLNAYQNNPSLVVGLSDTSAVPGMLFIYLFLISSKVLKNHFKRLQSSTDLFMS